MKVAIVGLGIVGGALKNYFDVKVSDEISFLYYDPNVEWAKDDFSDADYLFFCGPVPTDLETGLHQDLSVLEDTIKKCKEDTVIFIRSTVLPETSTILSKTWNREVVPMPEFLTERIANETMLNLPVLVGVQDAKENIKIFTDLKKMFPDKIFICTKKTEAEASKYVHNCLGALKVNYFNIVFDLCKSLDLSYNNVLEGAFDVTHFFSRMHSSVPGPDGKRGFGGTCFPKDLKAFVSKLESLDIQSDCLKGVLEDNKHYRKK